jgi:hypothetical protein
VPLNSNRKDDPVTNSRFHIEISTTGLGDSRANSYSIIETKAGIVTKRGDFLADVAEEALADGDNPF